MARFARSAPTLCIRRSTSICTSRQTLSCWPSSLALWPTRILSCPPAIRAPVLHHLLNSLSSAIAIVLLVQCVRLFPGEYYADRARMALEDENPSSAISYANEALKWERRNPNIFFYLGRALEALGNDKDKKEERIPFYVDALAAFDKARLLARSKKIIRWISLLSTTSWAASPKPNGCTASLDRSIRAPSRCRSFIKTISTPGRIPHPKKNRKLKTENGKRKLK